MALKTLVIVGEVTSLSDARYCAGMGVEMLGFPIDPQSPLFVSPDKFKQITDWVAGVKLVGEVASQDPEAIKAMTADYELDYLQVSQMTAEQLSQLDQPLIYASEGDHDMPVCDAIAFYLVDYTALPVSAENLIVQYEGASDALDAVLGLPHLAGIALKGSVEEDPGFKDYDQLADILEALEIEE